EEGKDGDDDDEEEGDDGEDDDEEEWDDGEDDDEEEMDDGEDEDEEEEDEEEFEEGDGEEKGEEVDNADSVVVKKYKMNKYLKNFIRQYLRNFRNDDRIHSYHKEGNDDNDHTEKITTLVSIKMTTMRNEIIEASLYPKRNQ
ncbi:Prostatic spermine-binding protein, partial [Schistosoma japonicum]